MALVHVDGFEAWNFTTTVSEAFNRLGYTEMEGSASSFSARRNDPASILNYGINGYTSISISSFGRGFTTPLKGTFGKGILSLLFYAVPTTSLSTGNFGTFFAVRSGGADVVAFRGVQAVSNFPNAGFLIELFAGGVRIGTFLFGYPMFNRWARWSLVWDTTGANVTAALYREDQLILQGTGGTQGAGVPINSYRIRSAAGLVFYDSVTVWDDPVGDLSTAISPHWVSCTFASPDLLGPTSGDFVSYDGILSPASGDVFSESLLGTSPNQGILTTVSSGTVDLPFGSQLEIDSATAILGIAPKTQVLGEGLVTATQRLISGTTASSPFSKDVSTPALLSETFATDPETEEPWEIPSRTTIIDPEGDGGFELGPTLQDNGWQSFALADQVEWHCGALGAIEGLRGAYLSFDGGQTDLSSNLNSVYSSRSIFWKEFTAPPGVHQVVLRFLLRGRRTTSITSRFWTGLLNPSEDPTVISPSGLNQRPRRFWILNQESTLPNSSTSFAPHQALANSDFAFQEPRALRTLPKRVVPGQSYLLCFGFDGSGSPYDIGPAVDSIALYGYSGSIANLFLRHTAT